MALASLSLTNSGAFFLPWVTVSTLFRAL